MAHTATPWHFIEYAGWFNLQEEKFYGGRDLLDSDECPEAEDNAAFIVQAVNSHDVLLEALEKYVHHWDLFFSEPKVGQPPSIHVLKDAIKKAKGL